MRSQPPLAHAGCSTRRVSMHTRDAPMQYLAKVYRIIARNTTMVFNIAKIAPLYRKVRAAVANGSTPKTDQMAAKLLEVWLGDKVYESGMYMYVDSKGNVGIETNEKPKREGDVRFVILSDTHECHRLLSVPRGDVLVHAGDFLMMNALFGREASVQKIEDFNDWLGTQPHKEKFVICGNHDTGAASLGREKLAGMFSNATYLENEVAHLRCGVSIFGTPASKRNSPFSPNDAFQYSPEELQNIVNSIPGKVDVIVSHGPPDDLEPLNNYISQNNPKLCIFGHTHERNTSLTNGEYFGDSKSSEATLGLNGATIGKNFNPSQLPIVYDYKVDLVPGEDRFATSKL